MSVLWLSLLCMRQRHFTLHYTLKATETYGQLSTNRKSRNKQWEWLNKSHGWVTEVKHQEPNSPLSN